MSKSCQCSKLGRGTHGRAHTQTTVISKFYFSGLVTQCWL